MDKTKLKLSRRSFMSASVAAAAGLTVYGCRRKPSETAQTAQPTTAIDADRFGIAYYEKDPAYKYGSTGHNCGGRCITKAHVVNGRIIRLLTDESDTAFDGTPIDNNNRNSTQSRACSRCRAYKGRLYHPGRMHYPLKQTKERGDMTGFIRISWQQALQEITDRLKAVQNEYGPEAFHSIYACGAIASPFQGGSYTGVFSSYDWGEQAAALRLLGGSSTYTSDYSFHQASYMGAYGPAFSGMINTAPSADDIAGTGKYIVLWGSNIPTTHNPKAFPWVKGMEDMKKRDKDARVIFIGPEFSEIGISMADEWIRTRPYTDVAVINAMIYEMIVNTVNPDGTLKPESERWLDLDYLDTMAYGFFDSPEFWMEQRAEGGDAPGTISMTPKAGYTKINAVPAGKSLSAYIMGNDDRLTKLAYGSSNYTAAKFTEAKPGLMRNTAICSYNDGGGKTVYEYKKIMKTPKTPEWASGISGIPAQRIRDLAQMYVMAAKNGEPVWNEWAGGQLKQADGCVTLFSIQTLLIVTRNWGLTGTGIANNTIGRTKISDPNEIQEADVTPSTWANVPAMPTHPQISVIQWHNAIKFAFGDQLKKNGYKHNVPDWKQGPKTGVAYFSDGGVKSLVTRHLRAGGPDAPVFTVKGADGITRSYYDFEGRAQNKPKFAGYRFILNSAGNIPVNQHPNPIDSIEMFKNLPTYGYTNTRLNVENMKDAFYMVSFDNFMAPSARYSDYVLPATTSWEQHDFMSIDATGTLFIDKAIDGPGESMAAWDFAREWIKVYAGEDSAKMFTGLNADSTFGDVVKEKFENNISKNANSTFHNKSWDEFLAKPFSPAKPSPNTTARASKIPMRDSLDNYLASEDKAGKPFFGGVVSADYETIYGFGKDQFAETETCPRQTKRFHLYSGSLVWRYENLFSKWHGYLPLDQQGQNNKDAEGDPVVYPIAMYFDYRDYYVEAYGLKDASALNGRYLMTTTHDRFRAHSSQAENPFLRELTHRTLGGELYSGNDWNNYAISDGSFINFPLLNLKIGANGLPTDPEIASYTDIWVNDEDFKDMPDGTLVKVENEIGAVYCTLRKTKRCVPGYVGLHQGCWYDPRTINGRIVDVGGNCNTLMSTKPSRIDHGNAQQSAMVKITRVR